MIDKSMQNITKAGNVQTELNEIKTFQKSVDSYWTISTNTCGGIYTVFCC